MTEKFKILLVDDEKSNIIVLNHILKPTYTTLVALNGKRALEIARESMPDIILLDVVMPDMSGFEVLAELKNSDVTRKIPVMIITGLESVKDEENGFFLGAVDYITKPFHNTIVRARVKTHLQIVRQMRTIEHLVMMDALTELPNRRSFNIKLEEELGRAVRESAPLSLLMIDVDHFKSYNDSYGHPQGDVLLQAISEIFRNTLQRSSDFIARWGGEEFAALLPNTDLAGAMEIADRIRLCVESAVIPYAGGGKNTKVTVSIGAAVRLQDSGDSAEDILFKADKALYTAKSTGRNRACPYD